MVSQKGRFHPWVRRFREAVQRQEVGPISHLTLHYRAALFRWGASGFRHTMDDPLLVEMSIHHFDLIRALLGRDPVDVAGASWNTPWSERRRPGVAPSPCSGGPASAQSCGWHRL